ncbi:hypothetical protein CCS01_00010, partial [Rhodopila globiformis]
MPHQTTVFEQIVEQFSWNRFDHHVRAHGADDNQRGFTSRQHFLALLAGTLSGQQGLRPLIATLAPDSEALRQLGGVAPSRSTLADASHDRPAGLGVSSIGASRVGLGCNSAAESLINKRLPDSSSPGSSMHRQSALERLTDASTCLARRPVGADQGPFAGPSGVRWRDRCEQ